MGKVLKFEDLKIWQESRVLAQEIFTHILSNKEFKDYALKDQINRSSASTMDNIAEGFERKGNKEFRQFLTFAQMTKYNHNCTDLWTDSTLAKRLLKHL